MAGSKADSQDGGEMAACLRGMESTLERFIAEAAGRPQSLADAVRWAVFGGGKRIRPRMCIAAAVAVGGSANDAVWPACAVELLHSYTLVHDDLPSMDNDSERRGRPSVWAKFGEANAVLAGDALQAIAFSAAARSPRNSSAILAELADKAVGVVRGQCAEPTARTPDDMEFVFAHKTGDLFEAAAVMGALAGGGSERDVACLRAYAHSFGMAFQFRDDILDGGDGDFSALSFLSEKEAEERLSAHVDAAKAALAGLPGDVSALASLAEKLAKPSA